MTRMNPDGSIPFDEHMAALQAVMDHEILAVQYLRAALASDDPAERATALDMCLMCWRPSAECVCAAFLPPDGEA